MWLTSRSCLWGVEVVWLTSAETTATTKEDVEHYRSRGLWTEEEMEETRRHGWLLDTGQNSSPHSSCSIWGEAS